MIKILAGLLDRVSREPTANKPTPIAKPVQSTTTGDFRAVSIAPSLECCSTAMHAQGKLYLMREAPRLPLGACTMPANCSCKFRKTADRRTGDRRLFGSTGTNHWFAGPDNRKNGRRRATGR
ncbi:MAG: hypothetical protein ABSF94_19145 [Steroidobacteraceae bacterium]|jgi:hypothetical protein